MSLVAMSASYSLLTIGRVAVTLSQLDHPHQAGSKLLILRRSEPL